jgi:hypothetical protein
MLRLARVHVTSHTNPTRSRLKLLSSTRSADCSVTVRCLRRGGRLVTGVAGEAAIAGRAVGLCWRGCVDQGSSTESRSRSSQSREEIDGPHSLRRTVKIAVDVGVRNGSGFRPNAGGDLDDDRHHQRHLELHLVPSLADSDIEHSHDHRVGNRACSRLETARSEHAGRAICIWSGSRVAPGASTRRHGLPQADASANTQCLTHEVTGEPAKLRRSGRGFP